MLDAPALRDTGLLSSHQHHAVEKAKVFDAFAAFQTACTNLILYIVLYIYSILCGNITVTA